MLPLRDNIERKNFPIINTLLIALNVFFFFTQIGLSAGNQQLLFDLMVVPSRYFSSTTISFDRLTPLFSSMFMHGGLLHLAGNMLFLFIFGDNVEDRMGHGRYLVFYILAGLLSNLAHIYANPASSVPSLGASGAISGVLGAYILLYPAARVSTLIFLIFFFYVIEVPAWIFLGLWFLIQIQSGFSTVNGASGGVAWWAHIGGFVSGFILVLFFRKSRKEDYLKHF